MTHHLEWERTAEMCVVCPGCGFTFGADHMVDDEFGGQQCPECGTEDIDRWIAKGCP